MGNIIIELMNHRFKRGDTDFLFYDGNYYIRKYYEYHIYSMLKGSDVKFETIDRFEYLIEYGYAAIIENPTVNKLIFHLECLVANEHHLGKLNNYYLNLLFESLEYISNRETIIVVDIELNNTVKSILDNLVLAPYYIFRVLKIITCIGNSTSISNKSIIEYIIRLYPDDDVEKLISKCMLLYGGRIK